MVIMNDLEWPMLSYNVIYYETFRKVMKRTEKVTLRLCSKKCNKQYVNLIYSQVYNTYRKVILLPIVNQFLQLLFLGSGCLMKGVMKTSTPLLSTQKSFPPPPQGDLNIICTTFIFAYICTCVYIPFCSLWY